MAAVSTERKAGFGSFLLEIGTEELPAVACRTAAEQAPVLAAASFERHLLKVGRKQIETWVTPRRIAIFIGLVPLQPETRVTAKRGPRSDIAFDENGKPTEAGKGFARANGVSAGELKVREYQGRQFVFAVKRSTAEKSARTIIKNDICLEILSGFSFEKTMGWTGSKFRFPRPVRWLVLKFGDEDLVPEGELYPGSGLNDLFGNTTRGHRFLGRQEIIISKIDEYKSKLADNFVIVDQEERRRLILDGLSREAEKAGAAFSDPGGKLEEVIYLVENPSVKAGAFGAGHLRLPEKVLVTAMQSHQRYFPLMDTDGSLKAGFLYVTNGDPACAAGITEGNERVLEGRIEDAEFSFDKDLATGIESMSAGLESVVFHRRLGMLADKSRRLWSLAEAFADLVDLCGPDRKMAATAARLAKADLVSAMVQEFPDLQGYMGSIYAGLEGYPEDVCQALAEQYLPDQAGGDLPASAPGAVLAACDKVDNIIGAFSVDELPSGSRDPYGLRRAAAGLVDIIIRFRFDFDLTALLRSSHQLFIDQKADVITAGGVVASAFEFISERFQRRLVEDRVPVEVAEAARASGAKSILALGSLARALEKFRSRNAFDDFHTAYFRCTKIAAKAGAGFEAGAADPALFETEEERLLFEAIEGLRPLTEALAASRQYEKALELAASIRPAVDRFFDEVLVMAENAGLRKNRLALVTGAALLLRQLGDPMLAAAVPAPAGPEEKSGRKD